MRNYLVGLVIPLLDGFHLLFEGVMIDVFSKFAVK